MSVIACCEASYLMLLVYGQEVDVSEQPLQHIRLPIASPSSTPLIYAMPMCVAHCEMMHRQREPQVGTVNPRGRDISYRFSNKFHIPEIEVESC